MKRSPRWSSNDSLFDLPLDTSVRGVGGRRVETQTQAELPLEPATAVPPGIPATPAPPTVAGDGSRGPTSPMPSVPTFGQRLAGGGLDMAAHLVVLGFAITGSWWLGVPPSRLTLVPLALFSVGFSFIYHVLPLVFWGHTPGMAKSGLVARSIDGGPLTIGQAVRRWLGALLSVATLGLFLALGKERTLADRLSGSTVHSLGG